MLREDGRPPASPPSLWTFIFPPYSVADRVSAGGGLASEHEAISMLEMPIAELWRLVERQQLKDLKTLALVLLLRAYHPHLFKVPA